MRKHKLPPMLVSLLFTLHFSFVFAQNDFTTVSVKIGKQDSLVLPDGSKAWLNAATVFNYPKSFLGKKTIATLDGEAYFEFSEKNKEPVSIKAGSFIIQPDRGAKFNITAYAEDSITIITAIDKKIKIITFSEVITLKPGEQLQFPLDVGTNTKDATRKIDKQDVLAWKNGYFDFESIPLPSLLNQLKRWYDVQVEYADQFKPNKIVGRFPRTSPLTDILSLLEKVTDLKLKLEGKKVIVSK